MTSETVKSRHKHTARPVAANCSNLADEAIESMGWPDAFRARSLLRAALVRT